VIVDWRDIAAWVFIGCVVIAGVIGSVVFA